MKFKPLMTVLAVAMLASVPAFAEGGPKGDHKGPRHDRMMEKIDTDKDGKLSKAEFVAAQEARFTEMDADKDGFVTKEEGKAAHEAMRKKWKEKRAAGKGDVPPEAPPAE